MTGKTSGPGGCDFDEKDMTAIDPQSEQFIELLSEALRAGPGSPPWREAMERLRGMDGKAEAHDEYAMLLRAREDLESGREYKSIRPGPGFTRKVMSAIADQQTEAAAPSGVPVSTIIAVGGAMVIVALLVGLVFWMMPRAPTDSSAAAGIDALVRTYFGTTILDASFDSPLSPVWRTVGALPLESGKGLRAGPVVGSGFAGGAIVWRQPALAEQPLAIEASFKTSRNNDDVSPQLFISDQPDFSADRATSPHELVWLIQGAAAKVVLPDQRVEAQMDRAREMTVRIVLGRQFAVVEVNGKRLWAGPHHLSEQAERWIGVRFIRRGNDKGDHAVVQSVKVSKP